MCLKKVSDVLYFKAIVHDVAKTKLSKRHFTSVHIASMRAGLFVIFSHDTVLNYTGFAVKQALRIQINKSSKAS